MSDLATRACDHPDCVWIGVFVGPRTVDADSALTLHRLATHPESAAAASASPADAAAGLAGRSTAAPTHAGPSPATRSASPPPR